MKLKLLPLLVGTAFLTAAPFAQAELLVSEYFDYSPYGQDYTVVGHDGGTGWKAGEGWFGGSTTNGSTYLWGADLNPGVAGYNKTATMPTLRLLASSTRTMDAWRNLASPISLKPAENKSYYFSYLWARTDSVTTNGSEMSYFSLRTASGTQLFNIGVNGNENLYIEAQKDATGGSVTESAVNTGKVINVTGSLATTGKYLMIAKMDINADGTATIHLSAFDKNDTITGEPAVWDVSLTISSLADVEIGRITLTSGAYAGATYWDNLLVGENFADVTGYIPEPSAAAALLGLGALGLAVVRARRR